MSTLNTKKTTLVAALDHGDSEFQPKSLRNIYLENPILYHSNVNKRVFNEK